MKNFLNFIIENKETADHWLHVADIDDTLFHTTARIHVKNSKGETVQTLSNSEFNDHKLPAGHHYDFKEFRSAHKFAKESKPIVPMINKIKRIHNSIVTKYPNSKIIFNTARTDFDKKAKFLKTFHDHGIPIQHIHVHRAGNEKGASSPGEAKNMVLRRHLDTNKYGHVAMYDDSHSNLKHFLSLKNEYPHINFHAFHVKHDGSYSRVTPKDYKL